MTRVLDELPSDLALSPGAVGAYLGVTGWQIEYSIPGAESWLLLEDGQPYARIILPTDPTLIDFDKRYDEALRRLCQVYHWDPFQLANNVLAARSDVLHIRADQLILGDSIPLKQAEQLISGTLKMLSAAALAAIEPRASYPGRRPNAVRDFLDDDVRMGHTQRGSFIITVLTNLADDDVIPPESPENTETPKSIESSAASKIDEPTPEALESQVVVIPPFQRRVTATLASALQEVSRIVSSESTFTSGTSINTGVSAELCDSILEMTRFSGLRALDVGFLWAPAEVVPPPNINKVIFERDQFASLQTVRNRLRDRQDPQRMSIIGRVIKLQRSEESDDPNEATVTLRGIVDKNTRRQVKVTLSGQDHELAISAYREQFPIQVTGDLVRTANSITLRGEVTVEDLQRRRQQSSAADSE